MQIPCSIFFAAFVAIFFSSCASKSKVPVAAAMIKPKSIQEDGVGSVPAFVPAEFCGQGPSAKDLFDRVFPFPERRQALANALGDFPPIAGQKAYDDRLQLCVQLLSQLMDDLAKPRPSEQALEQKTGLVLFVSRARIPNFAQKMLALVERENGEPAWLGNLLTDDPIVARTILQQWFKKAALEIRATQSLQKIDASLYGKVAVAEGAKGLKDVMLQQPVLYDRYLTLLDGMVISLGQEEMDDILLLFALQNVSMRNLLSFRMARICQKNQRNFIVFLRQEHPLVVYRLLPILAGLGAEVAQNELSWIAKYHADRRLKLLAQTLLADSEVRQKSRQP